MKHKKAFKYLLWKTYFDRGLGLTSYVKYLIAMFGVYSYIEEIDIRIMMIVGFLYLGSCFLIGWLWFHYRLVDVENEIGNLYNPFQREVRRKLHGKKS